MKYIMMTLQCGLKKRVTLLQCPKTVCINFHLVASLVFSVCAECLAPNKGILIFPLGLKTVCIPVIGFSFLVLSLPYIDCAGYLSTN